MRKLNTLFFGVIVLFCVSQIQVNAQNLPFPQNITYDYGLMPSNANSQDAQNAYNTWKSNFVESCGNGNYRVRWDQSAQTVSEGIGYGMLLAAYAGDKTIFDGFWKYYQSFTNQHGVMHWKINGCSGVVGQNGATDAELDAAMGLIVADAQWGSSGSINYEQDAKSLIGIIKQHEVENGSYVLKAGDMFGGSDITNPSYYSPAYYRVYGEYTNDQSFWNNVAAKSYTVINNNLNAHNAVGGLVSDWTKANGSYVDVNWYYEGGKRYHYDAARTPWRIATDYAWFGVAEAASYSKKSSDFVRVNLGGTQNVKDGYLQNGSQYGQYHNSTFVGPFATAAIGGQNQNHLNASYADLVGINDANSYYNQTLKALTLFLLTGNFYNPLDVSGSPQPNLAPTISLTTDKFVYTEGDVVSILATASDSDGNITLVEFYNGTQKLGEDNSAPYSFNWNIVSSGTYTITAKATDNEGASTTSSSVSITVEEAPQPNLAPTISLTTDKSVYTEGDVVSILATASDSDGSVSLVEFYNGTQKLGEDNSAPYSFNWNIVSSGTYVITAKATDNESASTTSSFVSITVEEAPQPNLAPTISLTTDKSVYAEGDVVSILATASDSDGSVSLVEFYNGTQKLGEDNSAPYSFNWNIVSSGTYVITAKATDNEGASTTSSSVSITVEEAPQPNLAPTISLTTDKSVYAEGDVVSILATASDSDGSVSLVEFYNGTQKLGEDNSAPYSFNWNIVSSGTYTITAKATDNESASTTSSSVSITVETSGGDGDCISASIPDANNWLVRNDWADQNNGSQTGNSSSEMIITHRQWGRNFLWLINTQTVELVSGEEYTISFDFKGDPAVATQSIELGLANGVTWNGPTSMAIAEAEVSGSPSSSYSTLEVSFTSNSTGSAQIAIRFDWGNQVSEQIDLGIKNLNFCTSSNESNTARFAAFSSVNEKVNVYPNPFKNSATLLVESSNDLEALITISDASGKVINVINGFTNQPIDISTKETGIYFMQVKYGSGVYTTKLIKQ